MRNIILNGVDVNCKSHVDKVDAVELLYHTRTVIHSSYD